MVSKESLEKLTFTKFMNLAFMGLLSFYGWSVTSDIRRMAYSIEQLNIKMAMVATDQKHFERRLKRLEEK